MSWVDDAIAEFGRSLGLPDLQLGDQAPINLVFEKSGTLRSDSGANEAFSPVTSTPMRSAFESSTFVRFTR